MLVAVMILILIGYYYMSRDVICEQDVGLKKVLNIGYKVLCKGWYWLLKVVFSILVYTFLVTIIILIFSSKREEQIKEINQLINKGSHFFSRIFSVLAIICFQLWILITIPYYLLSTNLTNIYILIFMIYVIQITIAVIRVSLLLFVTKRLGQSQPTKQLLNKRILKAVLFTPIISIAVVYISILIFKLSGITLNESGTESFEFWLLKTICYVIIVANLIYSWLLIINPQDYKVLTFKQIYPKGKYLFLNVVVIGSVILISVTTFELHSTLNKVLAVIGIVALLWWTVINWFAVYKIDKFKNLRIIVQLIAIFLISVSFFNLQPKTYIAYSDERQVLPEYELVTLEQAIDYGTVESAKALSVNCETDEQIRTFLDSLVSGQLDNVEYLSINWDPKNNIDVSAYPQVQNIDLRSLHKLRRLDVSTLLPAIPFSLDVTGLDNLEYITFDIALGDDGKELLDVKGMETLHQLKYVYVDNDDLSELQLPFVENDYCYVVENIEECNLESEPSNYTSKYLRNERFAKGQMVPSLKQIEWTGMLYKANISPENLDIIKEYEIPVKEASSSRTIRWDNDKQTWREVA